MKTIFIIDIDCIIQSPCPAVQNTHQESPYPVQRQGEEIAKPPSKW